MLVGPGVVNANISHDAFTANAGNGLNLDHLSASTTVTGSTASGNRWAGFRVGASKGVVLQQVVGNNDKMGIELAPGTGNTRVDRSTLTQDRVGVYVRNATGITLSHLTVQDPTLIGALLNAPGVQIVDSTFAGSNLAVEVRASAQLVQVSINGGRRGIAIYPSQSLTADHLHVTARHVALELGVAATATVRDSTLLAPVPHSGGHVTTVQTKQQSLPISWVIILIGLGLLAFAVVMEIVRHLRERRDPAGAVTAKVWNL